VALWRRIVVLGLIVLVGIIYSGTLLRNLNESDRRSLQLKEAPMEGDHISVSLRVISVNLANSEVTARMSFRVNGELAKDPVTPSVDLTLFLNAIRGPQEITFPRGRRINPIEAVFPLDGNANNYPFDKYGSSIWIMVTKKPVQARRPSMPSIESTPHESLPDEAASDLFIAAPQESEPVPVRSSMIASIPGVKFEGKTMDRPDQGMEGFNLVVRRADNVIVVSVLVMVLMMSLAISILLMSFRALLSEERMELLPLSLCVSLLFGLPALRNVQPAVPALGVLGDYLSFIWAEMLVAVSAVMVIWTWLIRQRQPVGIVKL
jgi:hypothetical protein